MPRFLILLLSTLFLSGCVVPLKRYQLLETQQKRLQTQLNREREELAQLQGIRSTLESQLQKSQQVVLAGKADRERLATLTQNYNTLVAEHNQLADNYARLTALFDSTQRGNAALISQLETELEATSRTLRTTTRAKKPASRSRRRRR